jgi:hypothetical protein
MVFLLGLTRFIDRETITTKAQNMELNSIMVLSVMLYINRKMMKKAGQNSMLVLPFFNQIIARA